MEERHYRECHYAASQRSPTHIASADIIDSHKTKKLFNHSSNNHYYSVKNGITDKRPTVPIAHQPQHNPPFFHVDSSTLSKAAKRLVLTKKRSDQLNDNYDSNSNSQAQGGERSLINNCAEVGKPNGITNISVECGNINGSGTNEDTVSCYGGGCVNKEPSIDQQLLQQHSDWEFDDDDELNSVDSCKSPASGEGNHYCATQINFRNGTPPRPGGNHARRFSFVGSTMATSEYSLAERSNGPSQFRQNSLGEQYSVGNGLSKRFKTGSICTGEGMVDVNNNSTSMKMASSTLHLADGKSTLSRRAMKIAQKAQKLSISSISSELSSSASALYSLFTESSTNNNYTSATSSDNVQYQFTNYSNSDKHRTTSTNNNSIGCSSRNKSNGMDDRELTLFFLVCE